MVAIFLLQVAMLLDESLLYNYSLCMIDTFHLIIVCPGPLPDKICGSW